MNPTIFVDTKTNRKVIVIKPVEPDKWLVERTDDHVRYFLDPTELQEVY